MNELAIFLCKSLLGWHATQVFLTLVFLTYLRSSQKNSLPDEQLPKTAVILCLRGADPFLPKCLRALLHQNYPQYDLKLIVDSQDDPAWQIVTEIISEERATNVEVSPLKVPRDNCSLKCSSLVQAISDLDESYKVVALVDADTVVHPNWLRELVNPLADPKIGATTGNRWYVPTGSYWGSLVRYIGNVSTVVQMYLFRVPWGGTLAVKTSLLRQTELLDKWGEALGEDIMIRNILKKQGMQVKFVPSLIMVNREECDLSGFISSLQRQLLCARLYHPCWWALVSEAVSSILIPTVVLMLFVAALVTRQWYAAALSFGCFSSYLVGLLFLMLVLEEGIGQVIERHRQSVTKFSGATAMKMLMAIPLTQWVYGFALISSLRRATVQWRGVTYSVKGPWNIRLVEYRCYRSWHQPADGKVSL